MKRAWRAEFLQIAYTNLRDLLLSRNLNVTTLQLTDWSKLSGLP